jgi:hypothetical protein
MPAHQSTTDYLARTATAITDVHAQIRAQARTVSTDLAALFRALADRKELLFAVSLDETHPQVQPLLYEAADKVQTVERIATDAQALLGRLVGALAQDEAMTARLQGAEAAAAAADAPNAPNAPNAPEGGAAAGGA